jgi:hypothetical protein
MFNAYVSAVVKYQPGRIVVVQGQAPLFPDTRNGVPVTAPQDLRYWSLCNNNHAFPYPVVDCKADFQTARDSQGFYTYIVATPEDVPANAATDPTVTRLQWGSKDVDNALLLRNMLPAAGFGASVQDAQQAGCSTETKSFGDSVTCTKDIMKAYYPEARYWDKRVYEAGGWQTCVSQ